MANDVATHNANLPEYLRDKVKGDRFGNIDHTDLIIPRIKLLHAVSPELEEFDTAKAGEFWHTILQESLGQSLVGIPICVRKTQVLWAPRNDSRGILARSRDGIHWDPPQGQFEVQFKGNQTKYIWKLAPTVAESGLDQFGSSRNDDPRSPPASSLTYEILWWFPERRDLNVAIILNARGAVKVCQRLLSVIDAKPVDHYYQMYGINSVVAKGPEGQSFFNYAYSSMGYASEEDGDTAHQYYERFKDVAFRASDERDDSGDNNGPGGGHKPLETENRSPDSKF
jgi:hypothetical protein